MRRLSALMALMTLVALCATGLIGGVPLTSAGGAPQAGMTLVDVSYSPDSPQVGDRLREMGATPVLEVESAGRLRVWWPSARLDELRLIDGVISLAQPTRALTAAGTAQSEGDQALGASSARSRFGVDGSGVRVAVLSDGILGLVEAQQSGDAPKLASACGFTRIGAFACDSEAAILTGLGPNGETNFAQEGTALIEIVHDLAPGAEISFGAVADDLQHMTMVNHFAARVDIIVDDLSFLFRADQQSDVSRNTTAALERADWPLRLYVTAAGNWAASHWSGQWRAGSDGPDLGLPMPGAVQQFDSSAHRETLFGMANPLMVADGDAIEIALFWDDPRGRAVNDYDLYLLTPNGEVAAASELRQGTAGAWQSARESISYVHSGDDSLLHVVVQNHRDEAAPVRFDLFVARPGGSEPGLTYRTAASSLLAGSDAAGALTVGAVSLGQTAVAPYSSRGPTLNGALKPDLVGFDNITITRHTELGPTFAGTSAAAPHVAAIAALLLEAQPALLAVDGGSAIVERRVIRELLTSTADDIAPPGPDAASGYGVVNAESALAAATSDVAVVSSAANSGRGSLRSALAGDATTVLCNEEASTRTIVLQTPLPPVSAGTIISCPGWTIDAAALDVGLELGDRSEVTGLAVINAASAGLLVTGTDVRLTDISARNNQDGVRVAGSATITGSELVANRGAGIAILGEAGDVLVGATATPTAVRATSSRWAPIAPLPLPPLDARAGLSQTLIATVLVDGVPAPAGTVVSAYLDRRLAASVVVDDRASVMFTVSGPGRELRFAVDGVPTHEIDRRGESAAQRLRFSAGEYSTLMIRADSRNRLAHSVSEPGSGNLFSGNDIGIGFAETNTRGSSSRLRLAVDNRFAENGQDIASPYSAPRIELASLAPAGLSVSGATVEWAQVYLYGRVDIGGISQRILLGWTRGLFGRFRFEGLSVPDSVNSLTVVGYSSNGRVSAESPAFRLPQLARIDSVTPDDGYVDGGQRVEVCGDGVGSSTGATRVWFGAAQAEVTASWPECVQVLTPRGVAGSVDVTVLPPTGRVTTLVDGYTYGSQVEQLRTGLNLVVWRGEATSAARAFAALDGLEFIVWAWQPELSSGPWQVYSPSLPSTMNSLKLLQHDQPIWISLRSPDVEWRPE